MRTNQTIVASSEEEMGEVWKDLGEVMTWMEAEAHQEAVEQSYGLQYGFDVGGQVDDPIRLMW